MSIFGQRQANIGYEQLNILNNDSISFTELKKLIKQDAGVYFTLKYYYSSLYKACFTHKSESAKRVLKTF